MIDLERLRKPPEKAPLVPPLAQDDEVRNYLSHEIAGMTQKVSSRFRLEVSKPIVLFEINGADKESRIPGKYESLRVQHKRMQELGIETMQKYGLNPEIFSVPKVCYNGRTFSEVTIFPSETVPDLAFERFSEYITATHEPVHLKWTIKDVGEERWWNRVVKDIQLTTLFAWK